MRILWCAVFVVAACGSSSKSSLGNYAVGTNIGGGSIFGKDDCTYEGEPAVFMPFGSDATPSATPAPGPRFIGAPGKITVRCPKTTLTAEAFVPTGVKIDGPKTAKRGAPSELFSAHFVAGDRELEGDGSIDWTLGTDCSGRATYSPVLGAQDTGGKDRSRTLEPTAAGTCTVIVAITTGSPLYPSFVPKSFQAETRVTIE